MDPDDGRRPPEITVRDPAHPQRRAEVLAYGDDEPPGPSPLTARRVLAAAAVAGLVAGAAGLLELRDRREEAAQERQRAGQVSLSVLASRSGTSTTVVLRLRNDGPRPVRVLRGGAGSYGLLREAALAAGDLASLVLRPQAPCTTAGERPAPADVLALSVQTQAGLREVELPLPEPLDGAQLPRCDAAPLEQAVGVRIVDTTRRPRDVRVTVELVSSHDRGAQLVALSAGDGVRVVAQGTGGEDVPLPRRLSGATQLVAVLTVADCALALESDAEADQPGGQPLTAVLREPGGQVATVSASLPIDLVRALAERSCRGRR